MTDLLNIDSVIDVELLRAPRIWMSSGGLVLLALIYFLFSREFSTGRLPKIPIALQDEVPNKKDRIARFTSDTRNLLLSGYNQFQDQVFGVNTAGGLSVVLPLRFLDDLRGQRSMTFGRFLEEEFTLRQFTKLGNLSVEQIAVVNKELNPSLARYTPVIQEFICEEWPFAHFEDFTEVKIYPKINRLASQIMARFFHGVDAARNEEWIDIAAVYIHSAFFWTGNLKKWPKFIRPLIYPFVPGRQAMVGQFEAGRAIVAETLRKKKANGNRPLNDPPSLLDLLTSGKLAEHVDDVEEQTITQMNLLVAAIQSIAATITQCLIDLSVYQEYVPILREEIAQARAESNGKIDRDALQKMAKLDSVLKECQRLNSPDLASFQRKVADPVTISNGMQLPRGTHLMIPTGAINLDPNFFEHPFQFDGLRFYRKRMEKSSDAETKHQLVTVGKRDLAWGYGRHACPGRFIADVVMKLVIIEFLVRYDMRHPAGGERPENVEVEAIVAPDPEWVLLLTTASS